MKTMTLYKHVNNTDVAFCPTHVDEQFDTLVILGHWYNIVNPNKVLYISSDMIKVNKLDIDNWKLYGVL